MTDLNNCCKMCGKCCAVVISPYDLKAVYRQNRALHKNVSDYKRGDLTDEQIAKHNMLFSLINFTPISREEAFKLVPELHINVKKPFFYKCKHFNYETKLCDLHEKGLKPRFCVDYPLYDMPFETFMTFPVYHWFVPSCGYAEVWEQEKKRILDSRKAEGQ